MTIILGEIKKLLNIRIVFILIIFSTLFYDLFLQIPQAYKFDTSETKVKGLYERFYKELGPSISMEEYDNDVKSISLEIQNNLDKLVRENEIFADAGINNYEKLKSFRNGTMDLEYGIKENKERVDDELVNFDFNYKESSDQVFMLQEINRLEEAKNEAKEFGQNEEEAKKITDIRYPNASKEYKTRFIKMSRRTEISSMPNYIKWSITSDMGMIIILCIICSMVLIVPYYIREKINNVMPIYLSARIGRRMFNRQLWAVLITTTLTVVVQLIIYMIVAALKDFWIFWNCDINLIYDLAWYNMKFVNYIIVYSVLIWIFTIAIAFISYLISRKASNYIIGIAISIPVAMFSCLVAKYIFTGLLSIDKSRNLWLIVPIWFGVSVVAIAIKLYRDKKGDILL